MTDEIIFAKLPSGANDLKQLVQLRFYIEHCLLTMKKHNWVFDKSDPTWQALCHYYSLVIAIHLPRSQAYTGLRPCVELVASGATIPGFQYPNSWWCQYIQESLAPSLIFENIYGCVHFFGNPLGGGDCALPLAGFETYLSDTRPGKTLNFAMQMSNDGICVLTLNDGQFTSEVFPTEKLLFFSEQQIHQDLTSQVLNRWMRDSVLGIGLRDVMMEDGQVLIPTTAMASLLENNCENSERCFLTLSACANGIWDSKLAEFAIATLLKVEAKTPKSIDAFIKKLPQAAVGFLPPILKAYRL